MTPEEAIEIISHYDVSNINFYTTDGEEIPLVKWTDALDLALEALRKQLPIRPGHPEISESGKAVFPCGNCGGDLGEGEYCPECGQRVKWV